jgi:soluble lytic murein transglycosylase-like protein
VLFAHDSDFDSIVATAADAWDVEPALIKGIIAAESEFKPTAYKSEPQIGDASYGLMQLLYGTAKLLGYSGATGGLYDPTTNIRLGTRYLADLIKTARNGGYGVDSAISAYNAGFSAARDGDGKRTTNDPGAPFVNQTYVDKVVRYANAYSEGEVQQLDPVTVFASLPVGDVTLWSLITFAVPLLLLLVATKHHHR